MDMKNYIRLGLVAALMVAGCGNMMAQRMIRVSGTVYNTADAKKITPVTDAEVIVYSCKTVAQGRKLQKELNAKNKEIAVILDEENTTRIDKNGYYEILVPDNGALVFKTGMAEAVMVRVNNNQRIDVNVDLGLQLDEVVVTGIRTEPAAGTCDRRNERKQVYGGKYFRTAAENGKRICETDYTALYRNMRRYENGYRGIQQADSDRRKEIQRGTDKKNRI